MQFLLPTPLSPAADEAGSTTKRQLGATGDLTQHSETEAFQFKASFPDDSTLKIERKHLTAGKQNTVAASVSVAWQVVELLSDAVVHKDEVTMAGNSTTATVT